MTFSEVLKKLIEKSSTSKNQMIRETGIDRSSFFQLLNGKRFPSESIFHALLLFFVSHSTEGAAENSITQQDLDDLLKAYLTRTLTTKQYELWNISASFIHSANDALRSSDISHCPDSETDQKVFDFMARQADTPHGVLYFYLSPELMQKYQIITFIQKHFHSDSTVRQLAGIYQSSSNRFTSSLLRITAEYIGLLDRQPVNYSVFYSEDSGTGKQNVLFPYYLIGNHEALLLSADGNSAFPVTKSDDVLMIQKRFREIQSHASPLFTREKNYMDLARRLYAGYQSNAVQKIYSVAERPCFFEMVTPQVISRYAPSPEIESFAINYVNTVRSMPDFHALNSSEGVKQFDRDHQVTEAGMRLVMDDRDMSQLHQEYKKVLGDKIVLLPFSNCFIHNWEIAVYYPHTVFLSRYDNTDSIIRIRDKQVINALFAYYDSMFRLLHQST